MLQSTTRLTAAISFHLPSRGNAQTSEPMNNHGYRTRRSGSHVRQLSVRLCTLSLGSHWHFFLQIVLCRPMGICCQHISRLSVVQLQPLGVSHPCTLVSRCVGRTYTAHFPLSPIGKTVACLLGIPHVAYFCPKVTIVKGIYCS